MNFSGPEILQLLQLNESLQHRCVELSEAAKLSDQRAFALESATASAGKLSEHALQRVETLESLLAAANDEVNAQIRTRKELTNELRKLQSTMCELKKRATINEESERKAKSDLVSLSQRLAAVRARKDTLERESKVLQTLSCTVTESSVDENDTTTIFTHTPHVTRKKDYTDTITKREHDILLQQLLQQLENQTSTNTILTNHITKLEMEKVSLMKENEFLKKTKTTTTKDVIDDDDDDDDDDDIQSPYPMIKKMTSPTLVSSPGSVLIAERSMFYWQSALHQAYSSLILARTELETRDKKIQELEEEIIKYRNRVGDC